MTIEGEADSGAQGCLIHPEVFSLFGINAFTAPPTNFSWIVGDAGKLDVVGAAYLRVEHPYHPLLYKSDQQLFYICENMPKGVTLSLTGSQNFGIVPRKLKIARKVEDSSLKEKTAIAEEKLGIAEERRLVADARRLVEDERRLVAVELSYWDRMFDLMKKGEAT